MAIAVALDAPPIPELLPLFDAEALRRLDSRASSELGMPSILLMERAGVEAARAICDRFPSSRRCTILVGKGNNGGDGMVIARHLSDAGWAVRVGAPGDPPGTADGAVMTAIARALGIEVTSLDAAWPAEDDVLVDALLGTGARGAPAGLLGDAVERMSAHSGPIVAVDVPSGVDASTGRVEGSAVSAALTVTFGGDMVGLRVAPGSLRAGDVRVLDIGIPSALREPPAAWLATRAVLESLPTKTRGAEKYAAGAVLVVGGSPGLTGAPCLAARATLRAGAGLVAVAAPAGVQPLMAPQVPEVMVAPVVDENGFLALRSLPEVMAQARRVAVIAVGPGLGRAETTTSAVREIVEQVSQPLVLDADGLWHLGPRPTWLSGRTAATVLTPHTGEAARLLGTNRQEVDAGRLDAAAELAEMTGAVVVLKGPGTIVAAPREAPIVNATGGPPLSTAGTGDVLTGVVSAMLAAGEQPRPAAVLAVALHGVAGELTGRGDGTIASDVIEALPRAREAPPR